jgi:hypothetical protein
MRPNLDPIEQVYWHAYPNPDRKGCPGNDVLLSLARMEAHPDHTAGKHLQECSPCFRTFKEYQYEWRHDKLRTRLICIAAGLALGCGALAGAAIWFRKESSQLTAQLATIESQLHERDLRFRAFSAKSLTPASPTIAVFLRPGIFRDGNEGINQKLQLPTRPSEILLMLVLEDDIYPAYTVIVNSDNSREVGRVEGARITLVGNREKVVAVRFSSQLFNPGLYALRLFGDRSQNDKVLIDVFAMDVRSE